MARVGVVSLTLCLLLLLPPIHCQDDEDTQDDYMYNFLNPVDHYDIQQYYKCPDEDWVIGKFDNVVYCYRPFEYDGKNFPEDQDIHIVKNNYCRHLNNKSVIGNLHSREEMLFVKQSFRNVPKYSKYNYQDYLILGIYRLSGIQSTAIAYYPIDNLSLSYIYTLDKADVNAKGKTVITLELNAEGYHFNSASAALATPHTAFLCKIEAEKRVEYPPLKNVNNAVDLFDYVCGDNSPGQYWEVAQNCGEIWCYLFVNTTGPGIYAQHPTEFNYCGDLYPGANMASIHCKAEDEFMHRYDNGVTGFHKPYYVRTALKEYYRWQDGTPVNYVNFGSNYRLNTYSKVLPNVIEKRRDNENWVQANNIQYMVCKAKARKVGTSPYEVAEAAVPTKTVDGKQCADYGRGAHFTQCPDTSWIKQQIGNETRCYKEVTFGNDIDAYINGSLCQALYKSAKPASIESVYEQQFLSYRFDSAGLGLQPPPNVTSAMLSEFVWLDGNKSGYKLPGNYNWTQGKKVVMYLPYPYGPGQQVYDDGHYGMCKMPALPLNECHKPINAVPNPIGDYECPAGNWTVFKSCNQVNCYQTIPWPENSNGKDVMANNECGIALNNPKARVASIHCEREDRFIRGKFGKVFIGLKFNGTINDMPTWKWEDKTEFNYIPIEWERFDYRYQEYNFDNGRYRQATDLVGKVFTTSNRNDNIWQIENNAVLNMPVMCKVPATLKGGTTTSTASPGFIDDGLGPG